MRRYTTLGAAALIMAVALALLVFTFYPDSGSATKITNPVAETAISQPTPIVPPGTISITAATLAALKYEDVGGPGMARMRGLPTAIYARLIERGAAEAFAAGYTAIYDASVDMKTPAWLVVLVGDAISDGEFGTERVPVSQMIFVIDATTGMPGFGTAKTPPDELDLSTFTKVAIPAEYVPPDYDQPVTSPTPRDAHPVPAPGYPAPVAPGSTEPAYPVLRPAQP